MKIYTRTGDDGSTGLIGGTRVPKDDAAIECYGTVLASRLHVARAVCRRAERLLVASSRERTIEPIILIYINRLSDWLFVQARRANHIAGVADVPWRAK